MSMKETLPEATIDSIKDSIVRTSDLLKGGVPINLDETTVTSTNCYAYSIGIMYNFLTKMRGFYNPGFTEHNRYMPEDTPEILMQKVERDLENLSVRFREIKLGEKIELKENEYLVKVFMADPNEKIPNGDFHFVRQDRNTGKWFHKMGWELQPAIIRSDPEYDDGTTCEGEEPDNFISHWKDGFTFKYYSVGYLAIEEKCA